MTGVWIAYHSDWSGFAIFADELPAMRYAVEHSMSCTFVRFGDDPREATR